MVEYIALSDYNIGYTMQDAQEFSKLFMALLEKDPAMCQFIQQQFMGKYEYLTWFVYTSLLFGFLSFY